MSTDTARADLLRRAITATADAETAALSELFADDVRVTSPALTISSIDELAAELRTRDDAFSDLSVDFTAVDIVGDRGWAEWTATATHTDALVVDDVVLEATGAPVEVRGVTVARFSGGRIAELRQYADESGLLERSACSPTPEADAAAE
jgi:ketosteroid isomerase-like protein